MSFKTSTFRFVVCAASGMFPSLLLCGCLFHGDGSLSPISPPAALDPPAKGLIRSEKPVATAKAETAASDNAKPVGTREKLLRGSWYRIPLTAEESATGIYNEMPAKQENTSPEAANLHYRHDGLEQLMARPVAERTVMPELLTDRDPNVVATAAIALARQGHAEVAPHLIAAIPHLITAIQDEALPLPARCAAVEALGQLSGDGQVATLQKLADRYGHYTPGASTGYQADLHAELLRALARHIDAGDDPRFIAAAQVPSGLVRIELLRAWAAGKRGSMPREIVDLRSDDDPRVRAAALKALAARKHPAAGEYLTSALHDVDLPVRLAAIRGLGQLDDAQVRVVLADLLKDRSELIRAEAVAAIAIRGSRAVVFAAAGDKSWRVRMKVVEALAGYGDHDGAAVARRLLDDPSAEVERQVVRSLKTWPLEMAGPVLLEALSKDAVTVRKLAAEQLAACWPAGGRFPFDALPARRAEALRELRTRYQREFGNARAEVAMPSNAQPRVVVSDAEVEKLLVAGDFKALVEVGPTIVAALERLAIERNLTLLEPVYHDVLPRHSAVFALLDRMHGENVDQRRRAAEELVAAANKQPLSRLAVARLCELTTRETDAAVWLSTLDAVCKSSSEPAARMARSALGQAAGEVRRRACDYLAAHPDPAHEVFLVPLLGDSEQAVVVAAIRALGAAGQIQDIEVLKKQFASANEEVQLATAFALVQLRDKSGEEAIERLSYSSDLKTRAHVAQALGILGDPRLAGILIRLLDDPKATVSHAALASLPKAVGRDQGQSGDRAGIATTEQMARWKKWYATIR
ncbi:MAG: HEAT repeat domain-containing protein [Planctomycetota bacterium]